MITISLEDRNEKLSSAKKDLERLNKELILNVIRITIEIIP